MSCSGKVSRTFESFRVFEAAEKNKEKVEANCMRWLLFRVFWFSVSTNVLFCQENKNSNVELFPELDKNPLMSS